MKKAKSLPKMKADLQKIFNEFIRLRDKDLPCISCGQFKPLQAGHFYNVKNYDGIRFNEDNCHGECVKCNCFDEMHLFNYVENLIEKIGKERFEALKTAAFTYKVEGCKWSKTELAEKIDYYKDKIKELTN